MEVGPLSEWVTAGAEILAVCVALFLPYLTEYRSSKNRQKKFSGTIRHLALKIENGDRESKVDLSTFLKIGYLISNNKKEQDILTIGVDILKLLNKPVNPENDNKIHKLLNKLD